jgi:hypothetical protein
MPQSSGARSGCTGQTGYNFRKSRACLRDINWVCPEAQHVRPSLPLIIHYSYLSDLAQRQQPSSRELPPPPSQPPPAHPYIYLLLRRGFVLLTLSSVPTGSQKGSSQATSKFVSPVCALSSTSTKYLQAILAILITPPAVHPGSQRSGVGGYTSLLLCAETSAQLVVLGTHLSLALLLILKSQYGALAPLRRNPCATRQQSCTWFHSSHSSLSARPLFGSIRYGSIDHRCYKMYRICYQCDWFYMIPVYIERI